MNRKLPELLSPAGSLEALKAAIDGGADAIYMGGASFNARINAKNFSADEMSEAIRLAHAYGVKLYQTLNTMVLDREMDDLLRSAEASAKAGIDAFIVSDLGVASLLRSRLPDIPLHASTQMSVHSLRGACEIEKYGFTRVVPARELSRSDILELTRKSSLEIEIFVHGALCVSHSGQCLFSSLVGGRSGNRGLCAQPCRLPYASCGQAIKDKYPLSLKDLSLAQSVGEIIDSGVASLKIEGRMKSPEYVRGVTSIWRELLDEGRDATPKDMQRLASLFSRGGFTDGYYKSAIGRGMLGVRSDEDKQASRTLEKFKSIERKLPVDMSISLVPDLPVSLTLSSGEMTETVTGDTVQRAINAPLSEENIKKSLSRLGDTPFMLRTLKIHSEGDVMLPISSLNALRREGALSLTDALCTAKQVRIADTKIEECLASPQRRQVGRFFSPDQITDAARRYFYIITLPLDKFVKGGTAANGFVMPAVIMDREASSTEAMLVAAAALSPKYAIISNIGQISLVKKYMPDISLIADFRFNIGNSLSAAMTESLGFESYVASAELTLPQLRDLKGAKAAIVYGRIPLMTLEKCVIKELYGDGSACAVCDENKAALKDRRGFIFPVLRERDHRNIILNSLPTSMSDRGYELERSGIIDRHFLFYTETTSEVDRVIGAFENGAPLPFAVRRI